MHARWYPVPAPISTMVSTRSANFCASWSIKATRAGDERLVSPATGIDSLI